jgi:hypothetical protein
MQVDRRLTTHEVEVLVGWVLGRGAAAGAVGALVGDRHCGRGGGDRRGARRARFGTDPTLVASPPLGKPAPPASLARLDGGGQVSLEELRGPRGGGQLLGLLVRALP